jgi:PAS domain S-box-containing protein
LTRRPEKAGNKKPAGKSGENSPRGGRKKWLGRNLGQLMVLINGIILTATAYIILSIFIHSTVEEDYNRVMDDARLAVSRGLTDFGRSIQTIATILDLSSGQKPGVIKDNILRTATEIKNFDRIFWMSRDQGKWQVHELYALPDSGDVAPILAAGSEEKLLDFVLLNRNDGLNIISDFPGNRYMVELVDPVVKVKPVVLAQPVSAADPGKGIVVGIGRVTAALNQEWLDNHAMIENLVVRDSNTGDPVFYMGRSLKNDAAVKFDQETMATAGRTNWQVQVKANRDARMLLLERTPDFILIFGSVLTLIGTLYVRNNQRQSFRLMAMNRTLAQKNYDLNTEIAERERLNHSMRKAEREYKAIIDAVSDIIFEVSTDGRILFLNDTWNKITGFEEQDSLGQDLFNLLHPHDLEEQKKNFNLMVKGQRHAYRTLTRLKTTQSGYRSVEMAISMLRQDENNMLRVVGSFTDIEERRRTEKALGEAEKKYKAIVENAASGIYQVTTEGQFLSANPALARILGYSSPEQLISEVGNALDDLYIDRKERGRLLRELEAQGTSKQSENRVVTKDGRKIWVYENIRAVTDDDSTILYYEGSMEDITKRKEVEIKLREAKIQSDLASRAKSEFLANMSHELRTPLNAIIGFSEIIKNEVLGPMGNRQYWEYVRDIYDSGKRLLNIINEILDVSHIEAGERQLNEGLVKLGSVAASCIEFMTAKAEANKLSMTNMLIANVPDLIGEELAIKQILLNLLSNAIKFTPEGGRITLSHELDSEGQLRVSVTDTGIGLDEAEIEKALSPFGQVETTMSRSGSGVGLGLTLVDSLIKLHGGRLELFSQKGIGTTATIIFPARRVVLEKAGEAGAVSPRKTAASIRNLQ